MSHDTGVLNLIRNGRLANAVEKNRVNEEWERERERGKKMKAKWSLFWIAWRMARRKRFSSRNKNRGKGWYQPLDSLPIPLRRITSVHEGDTGPEARILPHHDRFTVFHDLCFRTAVKRNGEVTTIDKRGWPRCLLCGFESLEINCDRR